MAKRKTSTKKTETKLGLDLMNLSFEQARERLIDLLKNKSLFNRDHVLPSGQIASQYLDLKQSLLGAEGAFLASLCALHNLKDDVQFIGGLEPKVYSLAVAVSQLAFLRGQQIDTFYLRDCAKARTRGISRWIDGPLKPMSKVCLIQDEVVDGVKVIELVRTLQEEADAEIVQVIGIVDRLDGAKNRLADYGVDYTSILTMNDVMDPVTA
ncbi:MAG: hypothetical protein OXU45_08445 [Candidatus Melainabacteria bacterium]|nr:hypothetical protein [Candidatus Melainabacteria bacterium]